MSENKMFLLMLFLGLTAMAGVLGLWFVIIEYPIMILVILFILPTLGMLYTFRPLEEETEYADSKIDPSKVAEINEYMLKGWDRRH